MTETTKNNKVYPLASPQVAKMFGLNQSDADSGAPAKSGDFTQIVGNLFVKDNHEAKAAPADLPVAIKAKAQAEAQHTSVISHSSGHTSDSSEPQSESNSVLVTGIKNIVPYVVVFSVALFAYFYFFNSTSFNFSGLFKSAAPKTQKETLIQDLEKQNAVSYQNWISQFYFDVSDPGIIDPNTDNSGNGLSNFQKYLLNLNPKSYDTLGLGMADSQALEQGINPLSGTPLTEAQKSVIDKYFDFEVISNRLALAALQKKSQVAGASTNSVFTPQTAQAAGFNVNSGEQLMASLDINTDVNGTLEIPSLKISVPIIWSQDPKNFDKDLQTGVVHYPGTAMPGQLGTAYISGHSSNYAWAKGSYNQVFAPLDKLADNTSFTISVKTKDGKTSVLHYVVTGRQQYAPNDQAQFQNSAKSVVALSTCWPVGSTKYRLVVFGELTQVDNQ